MTRSKIDAARLDLIIKNTIEAINKSKDEIYDIAENAKAECKRLEEELSFLKTEVSQLILDVNRLEIELKESKKRLLNVNKNFEKYTQQELKEAYEKADKLRVELAVKRQHEQFLISRRNELEIRLKEAYKIVEKAESLISQVSVALGYLCGDLKQISIHLEDIQHKQMMGYRIIKAQEEERKRVARDIHDGPAQAMSNAVIKAEICERLIDVDINRAKEELCNLKQDVRECLKDVRKIIYNLRPMSLDDLGLVPTLQRYLHSFQEETGVKTIFRTRGERYEIKNEIIITIFRIVQESLSNIKKHANAENVSVGLEFLDMELKLYIFDDGVGFNYEKVRTNGFNNEGGFGLMSMSERVELLGGIFHVNSSPGKGTRILISIPYDLEEKIGNG